MSSQDDLGHGRVGTGPVWTLGHCMQGTWASILCCQYLQRPESWSPWIPRSDHERLNNCREGPEIHSHSPFSSKPFNLDLFTVPVRAILQTQWCTMAFTPTPQSSTGQVDRLTTCSWPTSSPSEPAWSSASSVCSSGTDSDLLLRLICVCAHVCSHMCTCVHICGVRRKLWVSFLEQCLPWFLFIYLFVFI